MFGRVRSIERSFLLAFSAFMFYAASLSAQSTASVSGIVEDSTGARISYAGIELINMNTGTELRSKTSREGIFSLPAVMPGVYLLQLEHPGFATTQLSGITLNVGDTRNLSVRLKAGEVSETLVVNASALTLNTVDASVGTVIDRQFVANMPLNGRSFQDLISMTPGVSTGSPQDSQNRGRAGDFVVNGQRSVSNYYAVDGVSGNTGAGDGSGYGQEASGGASASSTALGTTQSLISVDALQEFKVSSSTYSAEYGHSSGGQFSFVSRSGTNTYHGTAFDYLRNNYFDANDWFNDHYSVQGPALRQNDFGGTVGGPISIPRLYSGKDRSFAFFSYEGLRLSQPQAATLQYVPDKYMRAQAVAPIQAILNAFPIQTPGRVDFGTAASPGLAQFVQAYSTPSSIDSISLRFDETLSSKHSLFFRFADTSSYTTSRTLSQLFSLNGMNRSYTLGVISAFSHRLTNEFRFGLTTASASRNFSLDSFGGAVPVDLANSIGIGSISNPATVFGIYQAARPYNYAGLTASHTANRNAEGNLVDSFSMTVGKHLFKYGLDYRRIVSPLTPVGLRANVLFATEARAVSNTRASVRLTAEEGATPIFNSTGVYAQDEWRVAERLGLSLGLRWEVNPPPTEEHGLYAYTTLGDPYNPGTLTLAPRGTPLYKTAWYAIAPRLGFAWTANNQSGHETILRAGGGVFFDTANSIATYGYSADNSIVGFSGVSRVSGISLPLTAAQTNVAITANPQTTSVFAFPSHLQPPYTLQWNVSLNQALGTKQAFTMGYIAAVGRRLLQVRSQSIASLNPNFSYLYYLQTNVPSNFQSGQVEYQRMLDHGVQALLSYTWAHSIDYGSTNDSSSVLRGNSDYDLRHNLQAGVSWNLPGMAPESHLRLLLNDWGLDARYMVRTGFPVQVTGNLFTDPATGNQQYGTVNYDPTVPLYLYGSKARYPGGRTINAAAFTVSSTTVNGNSPRNFIRGFGAQQLNLAVRREFKLGETASILFRAETFNIFNHPNFGYIDTSLYDTTFGQAMSTLSNSLSTVASQYQQGGARSMQFALKARF